MNIQETKLELMQLLLLTEEEALLEKIQALFKEKDLNKEERIVVPKWQKDETLRRQEELKKYPELAENFDLVMEKLKSKYEL